MAASSRWIRPPGNISSALAPCSTPSGSPLATRRSSWWATTQLPARGDGTRRARDRIRSIPMRRWLVILCLAACSRDSGRASAVERGAPVVAQRRDDRVRDLSARHAVLATQPLLINVLAGATPLTDRARAELNERLEIFQMRVDQAGNLIAELEAIDSAQLEARLEDVLDALNRVDEARARAWEALHHGDRIRSS